MSAAAEPRLIRRLRACLEGLSGSEGGLADFSSAELEKAASWAVHNDGALLVDIQDEQSFRQID